MNIGINRYDESVCVLSSCSAGRNESFLDKIPFTVLKIRGTCTVVCTCIHRKIELILNNLFAPNVNQKPKLGYSSENSPFLLQIFIRY